MYVICDTCSILMLIRIVPEMFSNPKFGCKTINKVRNEFISTTRFKEKYPWRNNYITKLKSNDLVDKKTYISNYKLVNILSNNKNQNTDQYFSLSKVDKEIAAQIIGNDKFKISTGDQDLIDFFEQEFEINNVFPLQIIVDWLKLGFITWNSEIEKILEDWNDKNEKAQPLSSKLELKKITEYSYPGLTFND